MPIENFPILGAYDKQRFVQFSPEDCANWTLTKADSGKKTVSLYPALGRRHVNFLNINRLQFAVQPRALFRTRRYWYAVVVDQIFRIDEFYNIVNITASLPLSTIVGNVFFSYLAVVDLTFAGFVDGEDMYIYVEPTFLPDGAEVTPGSFSKVTDVNVVGKFPSKIATFGSRFVISFFESSEFLLSAINLNGAAFDPATCFTINGSPVFAYASDVIKQFGVLNNTLYIFSDFTTTIWSDIPSVFQAGSNTPAVTFPWKQSSSYDWDFGIADPLSLDTDFHRMVWLAQNQNGLVQIMVTRGALPERLSTKAIDVLFQRNENTGEISPFLSGNADGFLYQYENTIYYRLSAGRFQNDQILDQTTSANSIEFNFDTQQWIRCIEANGERCRIQKHVFFGTKHYVTVEEDNTVYEFSGQFYNNEVQNPPDSGNYETVPFRYEKVTPIIFEDDYSEFLTEYVQIDFVWGEDNNIQFISADPTPDLYDLTFKPHIELFYSDDGGISYNSADVLEFSQIGVYSWRMRWYQLGVSRNRSYKLVAVSTFPIVILGGVMLKRRVSGGAN